MTWIVRERVRDEKLTGFVMRRDEIRAERGLPASLDSQAVTTAITTATTSTGTTSTGSTSTGAATTGPTASGDAARFSNQAVLAAGGGAVCVAGE